MENNALCDSLIKWIQTFNVTAPHLTVQDLSDGVALAQVLTQIAPEWFDQLWLSKIKADDVSNWRLKVSNFKKILKGIQDYYQEIIGQPITVRLPDLNLIAEHNNAAELSRLLQLILGCAVNCDHKQEYIERIMGMEESDQHAVMTAIQELMTATPPAAVEPFPEIGEELKRLTEELEALKEAKLQIAQRCHELDNQVAMLQEDKLSLQGENERLIQELSKREGTDDLNSAAGRKHQQLQSQVEKLQEEMYKLDTSREEYRIKVEDLEKELQEFQQKNEDLQKIAEEARILKDEIDVLKETADKATKYEAIIESYKKKLEDLSDLRKQVKILEEKNIQYMQTNMELEEELKKGGSLKYQIELYKKQVQELHNKFSEETKKADKMEFENKKLNERLTALQREKDRLIAERDFLKETNEELKLTQLQQENTQLPADKEGLSGCSDSEILEIPPQIRERIIRLEHENKVLKLNKQANDEEQLQVYQTMLDDAQKHQSELQSENRLYNQRILELESQLADFHNTQTDTRIFKEVEMKQKLDMALAKLKDAESELERKSALLSEMEIQVNNSNGRILQMQETLNKKDEEMRFMEERYKKYLEKAKSVIRTLDPTQNPSAAPEIMALRNQLQEKDRLIESLERETEKSKALREMEERLITSAFYNLSKQLHRKAAEERLSNVNAGQTFLARQRQATSKRLGIGLAQRFWNRTIH